MTIDTRNEDTNGIHRLTDTPPAALFTAQSWAAINTEEIVCPEAVHVPTQPRQTSSAGVTHSEIVP